MVTVFVYINLLILIGFTTLSRYGFSRKVAQKKNNLTTRYLKYCLFLGGLLLIVFSLDNTIFLKPNFTVLQKGVPISDDIIFYGILFATAPVLAKLLPLKQKNNGSRNVEVADITDTDMLPSTYKEFSPFLVFGVVTVVFEEFFFRQFAFTTIYKVTGLSGDYLVVLSSIFFTVAHTSKKMLHLLLIFVFSVLMGKVFQHYETILYPILIHLCLNAAESIEVFSRIKKPV